MRDVKSVTLVPQRNKTNAHALLLKRNKVVWLVLHHSSQAAYKGLMTERDVISPFYVRRPRMSACVAHGAAAPRPHSGSPPV